ncbi:zinc finger protein 26 isoform X4 [Diceros bicornis minor]|uniref:zinc finger protein 26 isoform X4 n=1 Tax=Diceros bicornis minor TaxID=77932 RepID=UPI0026EBC4C6|nr:zinc finger protein 26 isoform X4 [Diceros bicornis minor]
MRLGAPCADQDPGQLRRQRSVRGVDGASPASVPPASGPSNARTEQRGMAAGCRTASCWGLLSFKDISLEFTWEEWQLLDSMQKYLYRNVILENYSNLLSVGYCGSKPDLIFKLEQGEEPCIINASISPQSCADVHSGWEESRTS